MAASRTSTRLQRTTTSSGPVLRSLSPSPAAATNRFAYSSSAAPFASSAASAFSTRPAASTAALLHRSASPTRVNLYNSHHSIATASSAVRSLYLGLSNNRHAAQQQKAGTNNKAATAQRRTCMCSPTSHPGSFRCSLHKSTSTSNNHSHQHHQGYSSSTRLNARRSAMTNSLVRIGTVEGDLVKRALAALIRPSSHHQKRRTAFQPRPSRLSQMNRAQDLVVVH